MARSRVVLGDLRVQVLERAGGGRSYTVVWPDCTVDAEADSYLRPFEGSGSQKTYAYSLVDHLRWRIREGLTTETITMRDLHRYMGAVGAQVPMPYEQPWRVPPQRPYGASALQVAAACLKGFYLNACASKGVNMRGRSRPGRACGAQSGRAVRGFCGTATRTCFITMSVPAAGRGPEGRQGDGRSRR